MDRLLALSRTKGAGVSRAASRWPALLALFVLLAGCSPAGSGSRARRALSEADFEDLLARVAAAWELQDTETAVALFTVDAVYLQPPDVQLFIGREQLRSYFGALQPGTTMVWHQTWFDPERQLGAGEFTFGRAGQETATHGVAVVELRDGLIAGWREYLQPGPASREQFLAIEGKDWQWHIGNYPC